MLQPAKVQPRVGSAEQPANRLIFSSPVRDPTLDQVQTTVPCHALFGPSQSVGEW